MTGFRHCKIFYKITDVAVAANHTVKIENEWKAEEISRLCKRTEGDDFSHHYWQAGNSPENLGETLWNMKMTIIEGVLWTVLKINRSKVGDRSRGWSKGSLFDSYYTKM